MDVFSKAEAADLWCLKFKTLEMRLIRDSRNKGKSMLGTRKSGGNWIVTREYMEDRFGTQKKEVGHRASQQ